MFPSVNDNQNFVPTCMCLTVASTGEDENTSVDSQKQRKLPSTEANCLLQKLCTNLTPFLCQIPIPRCIVIVLLGLLIFPITSSQSISSIEDPTDPAKALSSNLLISGDVFQSQSEPSEKSSKAFPKVQPLQRRVRNEKKRKRSKCPKPLKKTFCMNNGRCRWITDLKEPTCRCRKGWKGERCQEPQIDIDFSTNKHHTESEAVLTTVILVGFCFLALIMTICICWRRFKSVHNELKGEAMKSSTMIKGKPVDSAIIQCTRN